MGRNGESVMPTSPRRLVLHAPPRKPDSWNPRRIRPLSRARHLTIDEITEALIQITVYCGTPLKRHHELIGTCKVRVYILGAEDLSPRLETLLE
jgi:hypothetical protein